MDSERIGYTIGEVLMFFMMGYFVHYYRYSDPSVMNAAIIVSVGFAGAVFAAKSVELL